MYALLIYKRFLKMEEGRKSREMWIFAQMRESFPSDEFMDGLCPILQKPYGS